VFEHAIRGDGVSRESELMRTVVGLADTLVDEFDLDELLATLVFHCTNMLDAAGAGVMLLAPHHDPPVAAFSDEVTRAVQSFERQAREGPSFDCYATRAPVVNQMLGTTQRPRWPSFEPVALGAGFHSVTAVPMRRRGEAIGALSLFRCDTRPMRRIDLDAAQALADVATISIVRQWAKLERITVNTQLEGALDSRIIIEQAKGVLAERLGTDVDAAFSKLRQHARSSNRKLADVARAVVDGRLHINGAR
jgi:GAF domain-containing protein